MAGFVDMEMDDERAYDAPMPIATAKPTYPWGLRISLTDDDLKKLGLDAKCEHGDYLVFKCMARVTSCTESDGPDDEKCCRVELQIEKIKVLDDGDDDKDDED